MERNVEELREYFRSGKTKEASWRRSQLEGLYKFVTEREDDILRALKLDIGKHPVEAFRDEVNPFIHSSKVMNPVTSLIFISITSDVLYVFAEALSR